MECADILTGPLRNLFQLSLDTVTLPNEWKVHKIVPIPKNNDVTKVVNYRPISLLCVTSKLRETNWSPSYLQRSLVLYIGNLANVNSAF